ncbi:MAG: hypothetical protein FWB90_08330 [Fibromonadales bacterium]|nr:hypothetical protein [Fibromonadales bacterium]
MRTIPLYLLLFFALSHAYFGKENEGLAVFGWATLLHSPRTVSFEGAGSALPSQDFGAALMNPALLQGEGYGAGLSWQSGDLANNQGIAVFSHSFLSGRMQHTYGIVDNGDVQHYDEFGEEENMISRPIAQYYAITAAFPLNRFKFGITGRYLWERLAETPDSQIGMGLAIDWGFLWNPGSARYGFAFMGRYLGSQFRPYAKGGVNGFALASELAASAFWRPNQNMTWLFECSAPRYSPALGKLGLEYRFADPVLIRAGIQRELIDVARYARSVFDSNEKAPMAGFHRLFSAGAGYKLGNLIIDYSYSMLIEGMGSEHRIALSGNF